MSGIHKKKLYCVKCGFFVFERLMEVLGQAYSASLPGIWLNSSNFFRSWLQFGNTWWVTNKGLLGQEK